MLLRPAILADIPRIAALERLPAACDFVGQWSEERHRATLAGPDARYFACEDDPGELRAFAILRGFQESSRAIELKRIVVAAPGRGLGHKILEELIRMVFEEFGAHRLWLDVFDDNARARHVYESLGFVYEGTLREAARRGNEYFSLHVMSMLDREYAARARQMRVFQSSAEGPLC
jgi:RimJ/RimL family protein N-acetyltransferase